MGSFASKTVVVTGGAQGIGLATATAFAREGAAVFAFDVDAEALSELPEGVSGVMCDVGEPDDVERACRHIGERGSVHVLVNNAGVGGAWHDLLQTPTEEWDRVININLRGPWLMTKSLVPYMPKGASIINIASTRAFMSEPHTEPYSASKGGIIALTHSLAISLGPKRIRVNSISPGWIDTSPFRMTSKRHEPNLREIDHEQHPVGRVGGPTDIAEACVFLASDGAGFVTGTNLTVDGGMTVKMIYEE